MDRCKSAYLRAWYSDDAANSNTAQGYASPLTQQAFRDAQKLFALDLTKDARKAQLVGSVASLRDIQDLVRDSFAKYADERKHPKARKWLQRILSRVHHYSNIMDVLIQHRPEYVALAWGAMKFILMCAQNHETTICTISKALAQIADKLPQIELSSVLYPTERMQEAVERLYAALLRFLIRAHDWCQEGGWKHLVHSIMTFISSGALGDPTRAYQFHQSLRRRRAHTRATETTNNFWQARALNDWSMARESSLAVLQGNFRARFAMRDFSVDMISQLRERRVPVLWALQGPEGQRKAMSVSAFDIFKHLILQALQLDKVISNSTTEAGISLQCARYHRATTEQDWLRLLGSALPARSQIYIVVDLSTLDGRTMPDDRFSWPAAFRELFAEIAKRTPELQIKVLLLSDGQSCQIEKSSSDALVPVKVTQTPVRRRKRMGDWMPTQRRWKRQRDSVGGFAGRV